MGKIIREMTGPGRQKLENRGVESFGNGKHLPNRTLLKPRVLFLKAGQMLSIKTQARVIRKRQTFQLVDRNNVMTANQNGKHLSTTRK